MSLTSIEITGLRSFAKTRKLNLAVPNDKPGSGLTVLVGPNNSGKSTIVEALTLLTHQSGTSFTEGKRNKQAGDVVNIKLTDSTGLTQELKTVSAGGSEAAWSTPNSSSSPSNIFVLPSRRTFNPYFGKSSQNRVSYISNSTSQPLRNATIDRFHTRLFNIQDNRDSFNEVLGRVLIPVPDWYIDQSDQGQHYLKFKVGDSFHNSEGLGEGVISLLFIIDALYDSVPGDMIVIDEPELSLHPSLQKKLFALIVEYSADRQIVISTHSPYFISWESIFNGGKVIRVNKVEHASELFALSPATASKLKGFIANLNNPHILGLDAREVFFLEDGVILVEGQDDVIHYRKIAEQFGFKFENNFYGWGVGGADNMDTITQMLKELGFKRVVGILDKNKESVKQALECQHPEYKFFVIPADDVKSKRTIAAKSAIKGLLDQSGSLHAEFEEPVQEILTQVNNALTS